MPAEFLSDDQVAAYERFVGDLTHSELEAFCLLDSTALDLIADNAERTTGSARLCRSGRCGSWVTS